MDTNRSGADGTDRAGSCAEGQPGMQSCPGSHQAIPSLVDGCPAPHASQQFHLVLFEVQFQTMCPGCRCSVSAPRHSRYQFLQKGTEMPTACSPFFTEVSPPRCCLKTICSEAAHFRMGKRKKTQAGPVSLLPMEERSNRKLPTQWPRRDGFRVPATPRCRCQCHWVLWQLLRVPAWRGLC